MAQHLLADSIYIFLYSISPYLKYLISLFVSIYFVIRTTARPGLLRYNVRLAMLIRTGLVFYSRYHWYWVTHCKSFSYENTFCKTLLLWWLGYVMVKNIANFSWGIIGIKVMDCQLMIINQQEACINSFQPYYCKSLAWWIGFFSIRAIFGPSG